jgi:uncharacterized protein YcfJ
MLLDFLGEPWLVQYKLVSKGAKRTSFDYGSRKPAVSPPKALPPVKEPKAAKEGSVGGGGLFENLSQEERKKLGAVGVVGAVVGFILGAVLGGGASKPAASATEPTKKKGGWGK